MKIILDGRLISDKKTGISRYSEEILKIYMDLFGSENILLITTPHLKKHFTEIKTYKTDLKPFNLLHFFIFHRFLKKIDADIYHSPFYSNSFFKDRQKIYITTVHDLMYRIVNGFFGGFYVINRLAVIYYNLIVKTSLKNSNHIFSISEATNQDVKNIFGLNSTTIVEGVNLLETNNLNNVDFYNLNLRKKDFFLYTGNNRPHKNLTFLINCYIKSNSTKKLVLVGHKGENKAIGKKKIIYTGYINDASLKSLYENASAFVFPSLYEGFGLPVLESINSNTIVFSSDAGSLAEFGEFNIYYFSPYKEESLINLLDAVDSYQFNEESKKIIITRFNWNETKKQLRDFFIHNRLL
ncbi:MAG: glycosyltransferase family 4 protein [Candidatus Thiothrix sulfatifontis]|nr:MAG: glycosyltransferase family 4 protein [Candidatus Thiothrix sulfatifontis]